MVRDLRRTTTARFLCGFVGGVLIPGLIWLRAEPGGGQPLAATVTFALLLAAELLERLLFFQAAPASRMPGSLQ